MSRIIDALRELGKKTNSDHKVPKGKTVDEVVLDISKNFDLTGEKGADGKDGKDGTDGASVATITLYTTEGAVTSGVATLTDGTDISITVTTEPTPDPAES